jgi:hypothetical protein
MGVFTPSFVTNKGAFDIKLDLLIATSALTSQVLCGFSIF